MRKMYLSLLFSCISLVITAQLNAEPDIGVSSQKYDQFLPIYPRCENLDLKNTRSRLGKSKRLHNTNRFKTSLLKHLNLPKGYHKLTLYFQILENGSIDSSTVKSPYKIFEKEASRVTQAMPKTVPGRINGDNVGVQYATL